MVRYSLYKGDDGERQNVCYISFNRLETHSAAMSTLYPYAELKNSSPVFLSINSYWIVLMRPSWRLIGGMEPVCGTLVLKDVLSLPLAKW